MQAPNLSTPRIALLLAAALSVTTGFAQGYPDPNAQPPQGDPPGRVARISFSQGNVSLEPVGVDTFAQAELNYPLTAGDRVYADVQSIAELQTAGLAVRLGNGADVTLSSLTDQVAQLGLAQGSIRVSARDLTAPDGSQGTIEIDTPNGSILVLQPGDIRVDSYPQDDTTVVTVESGLVEITGPNFDQQLGARQSLRLSGSNQLYAQRVRVLPPDNLDRFATDRENLYQNAVAQQAEYVSPEMIGGADLAQYGDWSQSPEYGPVWYPRGVEVGWTPYHNGHWAWVAPWGWTWVETEPWGFAPFHYGRWANFGPPGSARWGWVPGPPPGVFGRPVRPVYSPALVAFVGGPSFSLSIGFGRDSGTGVTAWFPLGPREAYTPWYHTSPAYVNRVNVTNIYNRNVTEVRNTYVNRTTNVYVNNTTNVYANRSVATTAVTQRDFAAGHEVARSQQIRLDGNARMQLNNAPILPHPLVTPAATSAAPQAPARALPPNQARPVLETRGGLEGRGGNGDNRGNFGRNNNPPNQPMPVQTQQQPERTGAPAAFGRPVQPTAQPTPQAQAPQTQAQPQPSNPGFRQGFPNLRDHQPVANAPAATPAAATQAPPRTQPVPAATPAPSAPRPQPSVPQPQPTAPGRPAQVAPAATPAPAPAVAPVAPRPFDQQRPLINRTAPQPAQPPFVQQQQAIQQHDPGRPLGPQQVENLRAGRPAGASPTPEPSPHPAAPPARGGPVRPDPKLAPPPK